MHFRIGVNLGDVIVRDDTVYGDGVNIAARLEAIATPGGICLSRTVYDQVKGKLPLSYESLGKKALKNIAEPIEVFRVSPSASVASAALHTKWWRKPVARAASVVLVALGLAAGLVFLTWQQARSPATPDQTKPKPGLTLPEQPSIAVLPFVNFGGRPEDDWFADGMTETLITDLSRLDNLFVIARNSSFTYKGTPLDVRRVGQELGVRYVLEGSVQRTKDRLRVNAQLVETYTGQHVWAERYDRKLADVFEIQDDITDHIVTELDVKLRAGEQARTWRKGTRNREAYDLFLRAGAHLSKNTREGVAAAQALLEKALDVDPNFAQAMVWLSITHYNEGDAGWSPDSRQSYLKAVTLARRAIAIDPTLGEAYASLANTLLTLERHAEAVGAAEKALSLSPNDANVVALSGWILALNGRAEEAVSLVERALRLAPVPLSWYFGGLGDSLLFAKRVDEAIAAHRKCVERDPDFIWCRLGLTVGYVESGKLDLAAAQAKEAGRINPSITAEDNTYVRSIGIAEDRAWIVKALRRAGLP